MIKLYNADCVDVIKSDEFLELAKDKNVVIVTDPPFNVGYHYNTYKDNMPEDRYYEWLNHIFADYPLVCIHYPESLYKLAFELGYFPERVVSWVYNSNTAKQHRDIAFFRVSPDFNQVKQPYKNPNDKRVQKLIKNGGVRDYTIGGMSIKSRMFQAKRQNILVRCL